ncbi:(2Fe-2S)-binding protein [Desulfospira joergensenii]|uniref:(2Fe-2S)-binding protein n=1 Tax=Desulfospira joergensenii TaxID=53329 RepID=UPI0003B4E704|nr:(2Fe-2S)-binding protein [Desulfospira joergensenii]
MKEITITFTLNDKQVSATTSPNRLLVDFLRKDLGITSVKKGCSEGECGACTVICNGKPITSCTALAGQIHGAKIITLEGLRRDGELDILQETFMDTGAVQCGFCTPGMILSAKALLMENPNPGQEEIRRAMSGNLCRCTGYTKILEAVSLAADSPEGGTDGSE